MVFDSLKETNEPRLMNSVQQDGTRLVRVSDSESTGPLICIAEVIDCFVFPKIHAVRTGNIVFTESNPNVNGMISRCWQESESQMQMHMQSAPSPTSDVLYR